MAWQRIYTITLYIVGWVIKGKIVGWVILKVIAPRRLGWPDTPLSLTSGNSASSHPRIHPRVLWAIVFIIFHQPVIR